MSNPKRWIRNEPVYVKNSETGLYEISEWKGAMSVSDEKEFKVEKVEPVVSPTGAPYLNQYVVIVITVLAAVAGVLVSIPSLPPVVHAIAGVVIAIATAFGIASPGLRKPQDSAK